MKNKLTALVLMLALSFTLGALAAAAENDETSAAQETDAEGTLSFENLQNRMRESYYPLMALQESVETVENYDYEREENDLRDMLNKIADAQGMMVAPSTVDLSGVALADYGTVITNSAAMATTGMMYRSQLQTSYDALREKFNLLSNGKLRKSNEAAERQLRDLENQTLVFGESLFITYKGLEAQDVSMERTIEQLARTEKEMTLRRDLGQISALDAQKISDGLVQAKSGRATLEMKSDNILLQLKAMTGVGFDEQLSLGALPSVTAQQLAAMDFETDFARAKEASFDLFNAKKTYDDAHDAYIDALRQYGAHSKSNEYMAAVHDWQAAQYTYENAGQSYELNFRTLFAQVKDCAQVLDAKRSAQALEEKNYETAALKYRQGAISANALADAKDALGEARDAVAGASRDLFSVYRSYQWAVEYGILNS